MYSCHDKSRVWRLPEISTMSEATQVDELPVRRYDGERLAHVCSITIPSNQTLLFCRRVNWSTKYPADVEHHRVLSHYAITFSLVFPHVLFFGTLLLLSPRANLSVLRSCCASYLLSLYWRLYVCMFAWFTSSSTLLSFSVLFYYISRSNLFKFSFI